MHIPSQAPSPGARQSLRSTQVRLWRDEDRETDHDDDDEADYDDGEDEGIVVARHERWSSHPEFASPGR
jgi:hypothetical protein